MGAERQQLVQYDFQHGSCFLEYLIVPESQDSISGSRDLRIATAIASFLLLMLASIKLDQQFSVDTSKVRYEPAYWDLATKAKTSDLPAPQMLPQQPLGVS